MPVLAADSKAGCFQSSWPRPLDEVSSPSQAHQPVRRELVICLSPVAVADLRSVCGN